MLKYILWGSGLMLLSGFNGVWFLILNGLVLMGGAFMMNCNFNYFEGFTGFGMGVDLWSYGLVVLSLWVGGLMVLASNSIYTMKYNISLFLILIMLLVGMLLMTFVVKNLFLFYLYFEASLIPTLFLILGWGYQPERLQAGVYLLFYTMFASLPLLTGLFVLFYDYGSLYFNLLSMSSGGAGWLLYVVLIFAFLVKMPMFLVHLWLPKAHVEAPVSGSMILAGVLLKLGGYGLLRMMGLLEVEGVKYNWIWIGVSLIGGVVVSFICLRQTDLKALVAYSSVAHMGLALSGLLTLSCWGVGGSYTLMIGHGLCSSGLFCLVNMSYERLGSRSLVIAKGLLNLMPSLAFWWFLLCSVNMAAPPSVNLLGEIMLLNSVVSWSWLSMFSLMSLSFLGAAYTLYLYSYSQHGKVFSGLYSCNGGYSREYLLLFLHWLPVNLLVLKGDLFVIM